MGRRNGARLAGLAAGEGRQRALTLVAVHPRRVASGVGALVVEDRDIEGAAVAARGACSVGCCEDSAHCTWAAVACRRSR